MTEPHSGQWGAPAGIRRQQMRSMAATLCPRSTDGLSHAAVSRGA